MAQQAEILVDRRRLKRRLSLWRLLAVLGGLGIIAVLVLNSDQIAATAGLRPHIARVGISGIIRDTHEQQELFEKIADSDQVKAVIVRVNSPGGTATGGEALFHAIRDVAEKKPVVAVFSTMATSSAYIVGLATDRIVARGNSVTGSIGVILQWAEVSELLDKIGVTMEEVRSGELKGVPSPFRPLDEEGRELTREMVEDAENWFRGLVAERRAIEPASVPGLTQGRIYSGRQALEHDLIDQIGGEDEAVAWLEEEHRIREDLEVIDWKTDEGDGLGLLGTAARALAGMTGVSAENLLAGLAPVDALRAARLDGLISLWHPPKD